MLDEKNVQQFSFEKCFFRYLVYSM